MFCALASHINNCHANDAQVTKADPKDLNMEKLPDIEAATYSLKVLRRSNSNKIYLLESPSDPIPKTGRILLLKRETEPYMAFRVLKTYPEKKAVAAKRVKRYGNHRVLESNEAFLAIEKISDLDPPEPTQEDNADINEIEKKAGLKVLPFDPELDAPSSPPPKSHEKEETNKDDPEEIDSHLAVTVEEPQIIDHHRHWLTVGFGYVKNMAPPSTPGYYFFSSGNFRYAYTLGKILFFDRPRLQDSIALEGGFHLYKAINFAAANDSYTVTTLAATLRYNVQFSERFGIFLYGGVLYGFVVTSSQSQTAVTTSLNSVIPAVGGGLLLQIGPGWYTRLDAGFDSIGLGLVLRF
jgi:hypothetical protein